MISPIDSERTPLIFGDLAGNEEELNPAEELERGAHTLITDLLGDPERLERVLRSPERDIISSLLYEHLTRSIPGFQEGMQAIINDKEPTNPQGKQALFSFLSGDLKRDQEALALITPVLQEEAEKRNERYQKMLRDNQLNIW